MDKVRRVWINEDRYIYLCEDDLSVYNSDNKYQVDDEECYCLWHEEIKPEQDIMLKMMEIIKRRSLQEIKKSEADEHGYRLLRASQRYYRVSREEKDKAWLVRKATPYSIKMDLSAVTMLILKDIKEHYNGVIHIKTYNVMGILLTTPDNKMKWHMEKDMQASDRIEKKGAEYVTAGYLDELDKYGIDYNSDVVFDIEEISYNYGAGHYEVAYWATAPI